MALIRPGNRVTSETTPIFPDTAAPFVAAGEILGALRESCHTGLYDWICTETSDNDDCYRHQFDILLGSYFNTITLANFLETGLSVSCICVRFPELKYADIGVLQFVVSNPVIARGDAEVPSRPTYTHISKRWNKSNLTSTLNICATALGLISGESLDGTKIAEFSRMQAMNQLAQNLKATIDSFERGTINHVLNLLLAKSPPASLIRPLMNDMNLNRSMTAVARANVVSAMKRAVCCDFFFLNKEKTKVKSDIAGRILKMINCTMPSVTDARITHTLPDGRLIDGVLVTTENVKGLLASDLPIISTEADIPAAYSEMLITGTNLVTALLMGKAIRNFNEAAERLLAFEEGRINFDDFPELSVKNSEIPSTMRVTATVLGVGDNVVMVDALEKVYSRTRVPYPLLGAIDLTFVFPLGILKPPIDRYANSASDLAPAPFLNNYREFPPRSIWFFNKDGQMLHLTFENALPTIAHPIVYGITEALGELAQEPWVSARAPAPLGFTIQEILPHLARVQMVRFLEALLAYPTTPYPDATLINRKTTEQFFSYTNPFLPLEIHPFYDVYRVAQDLQIPCAEPLFTPLEPITVAASPRIINGNFPLPLCSSDFRSLRGQQLMQGRHVLPFPTVRAIRNTISDTNYPLALYIVEAAIHGDEVLFMESQRMVAACVNSYWNHHGGIAFLTSFPMIAYIYYNILPLIYSVECRTVYTDIMHHIFSLREVIKFFTLPSDPILGHSPEMLNHLLTDPAVFPPMLYNCDPILRTTNAYANRNIQLVTYGQRPPTVSNAEYPAEVDFNVITNVLHHGPPYSVNIRGNRGYHHDEEWTIHSKIFYYVFLPVVAKDKCCSMGVDFEMLYALLNTTRMPSSDKDSGSVDSNPLNARYLQPNSFNTLLNNGRITSLDTEALAVFIASVQRRRVGGTVPLRVSYRPDPGFQVLDLCDCQLVDGILYNGIIMMNYPQNDNTAIPFNYFYALPVHGFFDNRNTVEQSHRVSVNIRPLPEDLPLVPTFLGAECYRSIRASNCTFVRDVKTELPISASTYGLLACYFKVSPVALIHQLKSGLHPGFALTCVRQDRFMAEEVLFARRASESYYFGTSQITHRVENGGLAVDISQPRGHIDMGLGFTGSRLPAALHTVLTDMGNRCQNLFNARFPGQFRDPDVEEFIRRELTDNDSTALPKAPPQLMLPYDQAPVPPGIEHGQLSTVEFVLTPVTSDLRYFHNACNPRGRSGCLASVTGREEDPSSETMNRLMYDHSTPDPARPHVATNNPWASLKCSIGDRMYNSNKGFITSTDYYSPCSKFFTPARVEERGKRLIKLIAETAASVSPVTSDTEMQFVAPPGSNDIVTDPCALFQEAYPTLSASDSALFASYEGQSKADRPGSREGYFAQYLIHDKSPVAGVLSNCCASANRLPE